MNCIQEESVRAIDEVVGFELWSESRHQTWKEGAIDRRVPSSSNPQTAIFRTLLMLCSFYSSTTYMAYWVRREATGLWIYS